jgi:hypothetical protein
MLIGLSYPFGLDPNKILSYIISKENLPVIARVGHFIAGVANYFQYAY